jgi:hypothetical protein
VPSRWTAAWPTLARHDPTRELIDIIVAASTVTGVVFNSRPVRCPIF